MVTRRTTFVLPGDQGSDLFVGVNSPAPVREARITCVVCGKPAAIPIDAPSRLCGHCLADIKATAAHVQEVHTATLARFVAAWQLFDDIVAGASPSAQARWAKVEAARPAAMVSPEALARFQTTWVQRREEGGEFAELLLDYESLEHVADSTNQIFEWAQRAALEVEAAQAEVNA